MRTSRRNRSKRFGIVMACLYLILGVTVIFVALTYGNIVGDLYSSPIERVFMLFVGVAFLGESVACYRLANMIT